MEPPGPSPVHVNVKVNNYQNAQDGIWPNGPVQLARGRQARDPNARIVNCTVSSLAEFETSLREYLDSDPDQPEHTECQLSFWIGAIFIVPVPQRRGRRDPPSLSQSEQPANGLHHVPQTAHPYPSGADPAMAMTLPMPPLPTSPSDAGSGSNTKDDRQMTSMSLLEALTSLGDPKEKMRKQRAIAKVCIDAIQKVDGYRYSFHNCWNSREDDSFRFSYYCNDSLLNKDRAANGKGAKLGKRATKPVYDCKGVLSVKFSSTKQTVDVFYKHVPVHKTYEERAPPPRKDSKRRKFLEENDPDALVRIANRPRSAKQLSEADEDPVASLKPRKKKPKQESPPRTAANSIESDLRAQSLRSLLELIQTDPVPAPQPVREQPQHSQTNQVDASEDRPTQRKRSRNSCDVCKVKKTKCDGLRPVCNTCADKQRSCVYSDGAVEDRRQSAASPLQSNHSETVRQAQAASDQLSELEKTKKELEEARARIQQLEAGQSHASSAPSQTPQPPHPRPLPQSQPPPPSQPQPPPQQHIHTTPQIQPRQYDPFGNAVAHPYGINRSLDFKSVPHPAHSQVTHQMHAPSPGLPPTPDAPNPYGRDFAAWPTTSFYGYQNPQQHPHQHQHQPDQWAASRNNSQVFR